MKVIRHKSTARYAREAGANEETIPAVEWLLEVAAKPSQAAKRPVFRIDNEEVKDNLSLAKTEKHFSVEQITAGDNFARLAREGARIHSKKAELRTPYEKSLKSVADSLMLYQRLGKSFRPQNSTNFQQELNDLTKIFADGMAAARAHEAGTEHDEDEHQKFTRLLEIMIDPSMQEGDKSGVMFWPRTIPVGRGNRAQWQSLSTNILSSITSAAMAPSNWKVDFHPVTKSYAGMISAYAKNDPSAFNAHLSTYRDYLKQNGMSFNLDKTSKEFALTNFDPF